VVELLDLGEVVEDRRAAGADDRDPASPVRPCRDVEPELHPAP
jgi:hypothetical protein